MKRFLTLLCAFLLLLATALSGTSCAMEEVYQKTILTVFDTATVISGYEKSQSDFDAAAALIEAELTRYHKLYDIYESYGENNLKTVNDNAGITPVSVAPEIIDMLSYGIEMYHKTNGMTNIAIGAVTSIWHTARENEELPYDSDLKAAAEHISIESIEIDREMGTVYISDPLARIDVGAVAKGYACDKVCEMMKAKGLWGYGLSVGGNVKTVGTKADGEDWTIGVQDPDGLKPYFCTLPVTNASLVTSGSYQRYFVVDTVKYHHIINPDTLYPENTFDSVSVLCPSSAMGDALSTALFNMSYEDGLKLLEGFPEAEVLWRYADGKCEYTKGIKSVISFNE